MSRRPLAAGGDTLQKDNSRRVSHTVLACCWVGMALEALLVNIGGSSTFREGFVVPEVSG
jgi:hypothetical protein